MKLLKNDQIISWDQYTIEQESISSFELMQNASAVFANWFETLFIDKSKQVFVLSGSGNNGGDGFCVANLLLQSAYQVSVHHFNFGNNISGDNLQSQKQLETITSHDKFVPLNIPEDAIIIDAILGSGIKGKLKGDYKIAVQWLNKLTNKVISIDIPSGMDPDKVTKGECVKADHVLSFEIPKISFFLEDHGSHLDNWDFRPIGLSQKFIENLNVTNFLIDYSMVKSISKPRSTTANKKDFGFAQFCGGSPGMFGSVILASKSAMRCGLGRLGVATPAVYHNSLFVSVPEAMAQAGINENNNNLSRFNLLNDNINAIAIGPGLGTSPESTRYIDKFLELPDIPSVLDADALNIISRNMWQIRIAKNSIISPHKEEFERLFGKCKTHFDRIQRQIEQSQALGIYIILKGAYTTISSPEGDCYYNRIGNVGMATAGSGDVLTGMLLSFLSQGYNALETCIMGVFIHGSAGDSAAVKYGEVAMIASDIIEFIPSILKNINGK